METAPTEPMASRAPEGGRVLAAASGYSKPFCWASCGEALAGKAAS